MTDADTEVYCVISIHALRKESDWFIHSKIHAAITNFNPRSP